jgi:catechol-2,3-dioxygenase
MLQARTEIQLGVSDVRRSATFYAALFGATPLVDLESRVVFDLDAPPLVLTLECLPSARRRPDARGADRRRFAVLVPRPELVGKAAVALWRSGAKLRLLDEGIEARDPDGNGWRVRLDPREPERAVRVLAGEEDGP